MTTRRSLRTHVLAVLVVALVPILVLQALLSRQDAHRRGADALANLAVLVAALHDRDLAGAGDVVQALARLVDTVVADRGQCTLTLLDLVAASDNVDGLLISDGEGNVLCASPSVAAPPAIADHRHFREAVRTGTLAVGDFVAGGDGRTFMHLAMPVLSGRGELRYVVVAERTLDWLAQARARHPLPEGATLLVVDPDGALLASSPADALEDDAARIPDDELRYMAARLSGTIGAEGPDGARVAGFAPLGGTTGRGFVLVDVPGGAPAAGAGWPWQLSATLFVFAALIVTLAVAAALERTLFGPLLRIVGGLERLRQGHLDHRVETRTRIRELARLRDMINLMAEAIRDDATMIEQQRDELRAANLTLQSARIEPVARGDVDSLTHASSRQSILEQAARETARAKRHGRPLCFLVLDLDHFKEVNARFGRAAGDRVLRQFGRQIRAGLREGDMFGRLGREEFLIVLPETSRPAALDGAERLRQAVERMELKVGDETVRITVSIGVAEFGPDGDSAEELVNTADMAMYRAKEAGRNRVGTLDREPV